MERRVDVQNESSQVASCISVYSPFRIVFRCRKPAVVMARAATASNVSKAALVFIDESVRDSAQVYLKIMKEQVLPWVTVSFQKSYALTQNSATSHTSEATQQWCKTHLKRFCDKSMGPLTSTDLNLMYFAIWSILQNDVCVDAHSSTAVLKHALEKAGSHLSMDIVQRSCLPVVKPM